MLSFSVFSRARRVDVRLPHTMNESVPLHRVGPPTNGQHANGQPDGGQPANRQPADGQLANDSTTPQPQDVCVCNWPNPVKLPLTNILSV
ncbi:hypothetical protein GQ44DRAFT_711299 [Phaeosphaeriaceae sp. PMI808]|nr:hypothetical protein GQ44DRAFT_711299 [Phaeosphaeriaceae sp. PMI808]